MRDKKRKKKSCLPQFYSSLAPTRERMKDGLRSLTETKLLLSILEWFPMGFIKRMEGTPSTRHALGRYLPQVTLVGVWTSCFGAEAALAPCRLRGGAAFARPLLTRFLLLELEPREGEKGHKK